MPKYSWAPGYFLSSTETEMKGKKQYFPATWKTLPHKSSGFL